MPGCQLRPEGGNSRGGTPAEGSRRFGAKPFSSKRGLFFTVKGSRAPPKFPTHAHTTPPRPSPRGGGGRFTENPSRGSPKQGGGAGGVCVCVCGIWGAREAPLP